MQTENLNEMVQPDPKPTDSGLPNYMYTIFTEKATYDDVRQEVANAEEVVTDSTIPKVVPQTETQTPEVLSNNYQPESEEALIEYTARIHNKVQTFSIAGYWEIGRSINAFYKGKYGTNELDKIANSSGIGRDTLAKACRFAKQYSRDHLEILLKGNFVISWGQIAQNLTVEPKKVIEVYQQAPDRVQFYNGIIKLKNPSEGRGKSKGASISMPAAVGEPSTTGWVIETPILTAAPPEKVIPVNLIQTPDDHLKEIDDLRAENQRLRADLDHREYQVNQLEELFHESALELSGRDRLIEKLRATLKQVHNMVENGYDPVNILSQIDWHVRE